MLTYIRAHAYMYTSTYTHAHIHTCTHAHFYRHTCIHTHAHGSVDITTERCKICDDKKALSVKRKRGFFFFFAPR